MQLKLVHFEFQSSHPAFSTLWLSAYLTPGGDVMAATVLLPIVKYSKGQFSYIATTLRLLP